MRLSLKPIVDLLSRASGARQARRPTGRRRSPIALEMLETRNLLSIAGVTLTYGNLAIHAPTGNHGNVATISIDPSKHNVKATFNGQSAEFSASQVTTITYVGGTGGGDTFTNNTSMNSLEYGFGQHNTYTGGRGFNYVYFHSGGNTYNALAGSMNDVFEVGGRDTINTPARAVVSAYVY
jgi:hypothetical protein